MKYTVFPPCEELKEFISHFWTGTWDVSERGPNTSQYIVASSMTEITFVFSGAKRHSEMLCSTVQGHTNLPIQYSVDGYYHLFGVSFHSYAVPSLFNLPSSELNQQFLSLDTFLGKDGRILNEKVALATSTEQRISILSNYFLSKLRNQPSEDQLISEVIRQMKTRNGNISIEHLANHFGLSHKQFGRRFKEHSGFNPKMYARILRFEAVIKNYSQDVNFTDIALKNGYFDQAHFNHEFKSLSGFNPKDFWKMGQA